MRMATTLNVFTDIKRLLIGALAVAATTMLLTGVALRFARRERGGRTTIIYANASRTNRTSAGSSGSSRSNMPAPPEPLSPLQPSSFRVEQGKVSADREWRKYQLLHLHRSEGNQSQFLANASAESAGRWHGNAIASHGLMPADGHSANTLLARAPRSATQDILFYNDRGGYDDRFWPCMGHNKCFGYTRGEIEYFPEKYVMNSCTFTRYYESDVPMMLNLANPMLILPTYRKYHYLYLFHRSQCLSNIDISVCGDKQCTMSVNKSPWPCRTNNYALKASLDMVEYDKRQVPHSESKLIDYLNRECGILQPDDRRPAYKNKAVRAFVTVLVRLGRCAMGFNDYCPDPCKHHSACSKDNMLGSCYLIENPGNRYQTLIDPVFSWAKRLYVKVTYCPCVTGFRYNVTSEECEPVRKSCGRADACLHNGKCQPVPLSVQNIIGRQYNCQCPPAWHGMRCEESQDPCRVPENRRSCGEFQCRRSPADEVYGFVCICPPGYTLTRQLGLPTCHDVNECAVTAPCKNAARCRNQVGSFECVCSRGFTGRLCEIPPPEPYWLAWSPWTACLVTCSVGLQHRRRNCSLEGSCMGVQRDFKTCMGRHLDCTHKVLDAATPEVMSGGAGWREEEDSVQDDSWYFREFQLLRLGLNNRSTAEDELLSGTEDLLYKSMHYIAMIALAECLIVLALCRRIRVHRRV